MICRSTLPRWCNFLRFPASYFLLPPTLISISLFLNSVLYPCSSLHPSDLLFSLLFSHVLCSLAPLCSDLFPSTSLLCAPSLSPLFCSTSLSFYSVMVPFICSAILPSNYLNCSFSPRRCARLTSSCLCSDILPYPILLSNAVLSVPLLPYF